MKPFFTLFTTLIVVFPVYAQFQNSLPNVNPIRPDAAALFKPVDRPIGSFSGTVPIDIPIYTIEENKISIPISISYNTGGIKVEEVASSVGLGWALTTGGNITRVAHGKPDDDNGMLTINGKRKPSQMWPVPTNVEVMDIDKDFLDSQPDEFYFNINGRSGKFFFGENGGVMIVDQQPLEIQPIYASPTTRSVIKSWVITDEAGIKYYLGMNKEKSDSACDLTNLSYYDRTGNISVPGPRSYWSAWHLLEIRDMNDSPIARFEYKNSGSDFTVPSVAHTAPFIFGGLDCNPSELESDISYCVNSSSEKYLKKIITDKTTVEFLTSKRKDHGYKFDAVLVFDHNNLLKRRVNFSYDYFFQPYAPSGDLFDPVYKRLKLNYLAEYGSAMTDSLVHSFEYIDDVNLPSRLSSAKDYWGYYNGKESNTSSIPNGSYTWGGQTVHITDRGDRRPDPIYSRANTLRKINFPTGGYREFSYENNQTLTHFWTQMQIDPTHHNWRGFETLEFPGQNSWDPRYQHEFTVNSTSGGATLNYSMTPFQTLGTYSVKIKALSSPGSPGGDYKVFTDEEAGTVYLPNGLYRFELYYDSQTQFIYAEASWLEENLTNEGIVRYNEDFRKTNSLAGGLRIKEVRDYEPLSNKVSSTKYQYRLPSDTTLTSGLLISPPVFLFVGTCQDNFCSYLRLAAASCYPLSEAGGSYVYYPEVRVIEEGNGYTDREYSFAFDMLTYEVEAMLQSYPIVPKNNDGWKRGKLLIEKHYNSDHVLVSKNETQYPFLYPVAWGEEPIDSESAVNLKQQLGFKLAMFGRGTPATYTWCINKYTRDSRFVRPKASIKTDYTPAGPIETKTEFYYYNDLDRPLLKLEKTFLNNDKVKEKEYRYAFNSATDFRFELSTDDLTAKNALLARNYMHPIETVTYVNTVGSRTMLGAIKTSFRFFNGQQMELGVSKQYLSSSEFEELHFSSYDTKGNLQEQYKLNDVKKAYIWGYNSRYPVATITGADYSAAVQAIDTNLINSSSSTDEMIRTELNKLRTHLPQAHVTTFTHIPLLGINSFTDPKGYTYFYEYDMLGRLKVVRDQAGNIIKMLDYKYSRNSNE